MFCPNCGTEIKDNCSFCPECGSKIENSEVPTPIYNYKKKSSEFLEKCKTVAKELLEKIKVFFQKVKAKFKSISPKTYKIIGAVSAFLIIAFTVIMLITFSPANQMKRAISNRNMNTIIQLYSQAYSKNNNKRLAEYDKQLLVVLNEIYEFTNTYVPEGKSSKSAQDFINSRYSNIYVRNTDSAIYIIANTYSNNNDIMKLYEDINNLIVSKDNYNSALKYEHEGNYELSALYYAKVIEADNLYVVSRNKVVECNNIFVNGAGAVSSDSNVNSDSIDVVVTDGNATSGRQETTYNTGGGIPVATTARAKNTVPNNNTSSSSNKNNSSLAASYAAKAEQCFNNKNINGAVENMKAAIQNDSSNTVYKEKLAFYENYLPKPLYKKKSYSSSDHVDVEYFESFDDINGKKYYNVIDFSSGSGVNSGSITYLLNGNYDVIKGVFGRDEKDRNSVSHEYFEVFGDGTLIYTSKKVGKDVLPFSFEYNVSGINKMEIVFHSDTDDYWGTLVFISDLTAYKNF